jgi:hypothetical protein
VDDGKTAEKLTLLKRVYCYQYGELRSEIQKRSEDITEELQINTEFQNT